MDRPLSGKLALVTGGARGIGAAAAAELAKAGADIALTYSTSEIEAADVVADLRRLGVMAEAFKSDQSQPMAPSKLIKSVMSRFGRLDILIANAGIKISYQIDDPDCDLEGADTLFAINVGGTIATIRAAVRVMNDGGRIIAVGASLADRVGTPGLADFAATKAAIAGYCRGAAHDLGPKGITVNVVQTAAIDTYRVPPQGEIADAERASTVLKRFGKPSEVAHAIAFLAGPGAAFVTGSILNVDGGYSA